MPRFPGANWLGPVPNMRPGGMQEVRGLILHIQDGSETGTNSWFHNPAAKASAHFGNPKNGPVDQWVDTADMAWAESNGNPYWISVENEGHSGDELTPSQLENVAQLYAWLVTTYGVPLQISDNPNTPGLGWHGMGGAAWGGHFDCPGEPIKNQRAAILARAQQILNPPPDEEDIVQYIVCNERGVIATYGAAGKRVISGPEWDLGVQLIADGSAKFKVIPAYQYDSIPFASATAPSAGVLHVSGDLTVAQ